jgi:hypothetical protein
MGLSTGPFLNTGVAAFIKKHAALSTACFM